VVKDMPASGKNRLQQAKLCLLGRRFGRFHCAEARLRTNRST